MRVGLVLIPLTPEYDRIAHPCFQDVLACLNRTLGDLGHEVSTLTDVWPDGVKPIILNYCVASSPDAGPRALVPPEAAIIYNQEPFDSPWGVMWPRLADAVRSRGAELWEMRAENVARWRDVYGIEARHVPFGYVPEQTGEQVSQHFRSSANPQAAIALKAIRAAELRHQGDLAGGLAEIGEHREHPAVTPIAVQLLAELGVRGEELETAIDGALRVDPLNLRVWGVRRACLAPA